MKKFEYKSVMQIPKLDKIVINVGAGDAKENSKVIDTIIADITAITGQKAVPTLRKEVRCKLQAPSGHEDRRKGNTPRRQRCTSSWTDCSTSHCPRVRDFKGINPDAFDGRGNYALGLKEQLIFPEIEYDKVDKIRGMDIVLRNHG